MERLLPDPMADRRQLYAVIDQGSTLTKGALFSSAGGGRRLAERSVPVERRHGGGRIEHDAARIAAGVGRILDELLAEGRPAAVGLTCQRSTCLLWDRATGEPLTPALSWQDTSQAARTESLAAHADEVARRTGLRLSPHYAAPKLAQLLEELPGGRERAVAGELVAGTLDAFLVRQLTGIDATEPGHAGRTLLYRLDRDGWDPWLCDLFGIPEAALPRILPSAGARGETAGLPLAALAGDQQAALLGHGGWNRGVTAAHFGTGAFVLASTGDEPRRHPELLSAVLASTARRRRYQIEGSVNSAGSAADWAAGLAGIDLASFSRRHLDVDRLPLVMPSFAGAAAPWWRPRAGAVISGLGLESDGEELLGGVLVGVAMRVLDCVEALAAAGSETRVLRLSGKLSRLDGLVALLADAGQAPVEVAAEEETGLAGIARLAAAGLRGDEGPLLPPPEARSRRDPAWPPDRAAELRDRWRRFARRALDLEADLRPPTRG